MNEIVASTGTEQMISTLIGILAIGLGVLIVITYRKLNDYERWRKLFDKMGMNSDFCKELMTDIKNETTSVAKKQGIKEVRDRKITILDDVNTETIAKYETKAQVASERKLEKDKHDRESNREDIGGKV